MTCAHRVKVQHASLMAFGTLVATRGAALCSVQPVTTEQHAPLAAVARALVKAVPHTAGLNPRRFRVGAPMAGVGPGDAVFGAAPPENAVVDGALLDVFAGLSRAAQDRVSRAAGVAAADVLTTLQAAALAATFF